MRRYQNVFSLLIGLTLLATSQSVAGEDFDAESLQQDVIETIEKVRPAVVSIRGRGSIFSGVIVSPDGHILSAAHAVSPGRRYQVTFSDGRRSIGIGKGSNPRTDCALIQLNDPGDNLPHVPMGDSSSVAVNQPCLGLSYPGGQKAGSESIIRFGRIIRKTNGRSGRWLQTSALMEPGDSGGPLFDLNGYVIGIHSRIGTDTARNYEVPVNIFREFWNELNREQPFTYKGLRLGIRCEDSEGGGLDVLRVNAGSVAAKTGIKRDDKILELGGREVNQPADVRKILAVAHDDKAETIKVKVERGEETLDLEIVVEVPPSTPLPEIDHPKTPSPKAFSELRYFAKQFSDLENKLDDSCITITSKVGKDSSSITGVRIQATPWVVSKSSVVGKDPQFSIDGKSQPLKVVQRDLESDLVLLQADDDHAVGIKLETSAAQPLPGTFLLSPDHDGPGSISILGSSAFRSRRQQSRGFLGVMPVTYERNKGVRLEQVIDDGAAKWAGLVAGDVITKLNDTTIHSQQDLRSFLAKTDPNATITATLLREDDELTKSITLDAWPTTGRHAADRMSKSSRRDGFQEVLCHDADLKPSECGGPIFDLDGNFVGFNIARNSRIRCYALPASGLLDFVREASADAKETAEDEEADEKS